MKKKLIAVAIASLISGGAFAAPLSDTLTASETAAPLSAGAPTGVSQTGTISYDILNPDSGVTTTFTYDLGTSSWTVPTGSTWVVTGPNQFVDTAAGAGAALSLNPPSLTPPTNSTSGPSTLDPNAPVSATGFNSPITSSVLGASTVTGSTTSTAQETQTYAPSPDPVDYSLTLTSDPGNPILGTAPVAGSTTPTSLTGATGTFATTNVTVASVQGPVTTGSYTVSGTDPTALTVAGSVASLSTTGLSFGAITGTATADPLTGDITTTLDPVTTTFSVDAATGNTAVGGTLAVTGTTTTNGITNTGAITTDSLSTTGPGALTLSGNSLTNAAGHGITIGANSTVISGGNSTTPNSGVLTLADGDALGGTNLTIGGSAQVGAPTTVLEVTSAPDGTAVQTTVGAGTTDSTTTLQGGGSSVVLDNTGVALNGNTQVTGTLGVTGATTTNGITNTGALTQTGATTLTGVTNINTTGTSATTIGSATSATTVGGTLAVTGATTLTGALAANGGITSGTININNATSGANSITNVNTLGARQGNFGNTTGTAGVVNVRDGAATTITLDGATGAVSATAVDAATVNGGNVVATGNAYLGGATATTGANATLTATSSGVTVAAGKTVNMGGNRVQGVAAGVAATDAVNKSQLDDVNVEARRGIASVSAVAGIPGIEPGKQYNFGVGLGSYKGETAIAFGGNARFSADWAGRIAVGTTSGGSSTVSVGLGYSF